MDLETFSVFRRNVLAALPAYLVAQRWFGGKARQILKVEIVDTVPVGGGKDRVISFVVKVAYLDGPQETYSIPLIYAAPAGSAGDSASSLETGSAPVAALQTAFSSAAFLGELLDIIKREGVAEGEGGRWRGKRSLFCDELSGAGEAAPAKLLTGEQSNSSVIYGDRLILKFFRRVEEGENPDLEIGRFLTERARFPHVARIAGSLDYEMPDGSLATQAILQEFAANQGDAWRYALKTLGAFYERAGDLSSGAGLARGSQSVPEFAGEAMTRLLAEIELLGQRTAELHLALASAEDDAAFAAEPFTIEFQDRLQESFVKLTSDTLALLRACMAYVPAEYKGKAAEIAAREREILGIFRVALLAPIEAKRIRIHGDYHLGQVLYTGTDFVIIEFEGEPARSLAERRRKQSPLQDVAGMLRSFHYLAFAPLVAMAASGPDSRRAQLSRWAEAWSRCAANRFLGRYYEISGGANYLPASSQERGKLLEMYLLAKAIYELGYELNNRPSWVGIPLEGISGLLPEKE